MAELYTKEPKSDGEILHCDGRKALMIESLERGQFRLKKLTWRQDHRYNEHMGAWECWEQVLMTLEETKALKEYMKGA